MDNLLAKCTLPTTPNLFFNWLHKWLADQGLRWWIPGSLLDWTPSPNDDYYTQQGGNTLIRLGGVKSIEVSSEQLVPNSINVTITLLDPAYEEFWGRVVGALNEAWQDEDDRAGGGHSAQETNLTDDPERTSIDAAMSDIEEFETTRPDSGEYTIAQQVAFIALYYIRHAEQGRMYTIPRHCMAFGISDGTFGSWRNRLKPAVERYTDIQIGN